MMRTTVSTQPQIIIVACCITLRRSAYDTAGNIRSITKDGTVTKSFGYTNSSWPDLLTSVTSGSTTKDILYEGQTQTSDLPTSGNPITYYNGKDYTFTWTKGRQLASATVDGKQVSYTYDMSGVRTSKTVNGTTYNYTTLSGKAMRQQWGKKSLEFVYDDGNQPFAMIYNNGSTSTLYYYVLNAQGDVIALLNSAGALVASYNYGAWGNYSVHDDKGAKNTSPTFIGHINPLRYRGYYYDRETRLYYLQSRYYDFANCRFINADTFATTDANGFLSANMFAYCENNPIMGIDPTGEFAWLIGAVAGAAVNVATSVITQLHDSGNVDIGKVVVSGICGAVAGAGLPKVGGAIVGAATSLIDNISSNWGDASLTTGEKILDAVVATGFGALTGAMGSSVNAIKLDSAVSTVKSATKVLVNGGRKLFKKQAKKGLRKAGKYIGKSFFTYLAENSIYSGLAWGTSKYARASYRSFRR